jgi:hypothetical protein
MDIANHYLRISRSLSPSVKTKILLAAPSFSQRVPYHHTEHALRLSAQTSLRGHFPSASPQQMEVLTFYLACRTLPLLDSQEEAIKEKLDSLSEIDETLSLRLQRMMDRQTKLLETLSYLLKKMSDTSKTIVDNLK